MAVRLPPCASTAMSRPGTGCRTRRNAMGHPSVQAAGATMPPHHPYCHEPPASARTTDGIHERISGILLSPEQPRRLPDAWIHIAGRIPCFICSYRCTNLCSMSPWPRPVCFWPPAGWSGSWVWLWVARAYEPHGPQVSRVTAVPGSAASSLVYALLFGVWWLLAGRLT